MLFSSLEFLFLFIAVTIPIYFLCPIRWRNAVLFVTSLIFYGWGEPKYIILMATTIAIDYLFGWLIEKNIEDKGRAKRLLTIAIILNLASLGVFKYAGFITDNLRRIPVLAGLPKVELALPIGISFYTFQALSYVVDVYRGEVGAQRDPIAFGAYVTLFPQLIAGPIVRYRDIDAQLRTRSHSVEQVASGSRTFICGLAKKVLLANAAGELWSYFSSLPGDELTTVGAWFGIICYSFQLYFDFSGYSDMAIGLGRIFGFKFLENFNYPYISRSITEFWRRWHISLSTWFREYVYIPLGGNRRGTARTYLNLLVVWMLTGIWHGASWNFLLWGLYYALLLIIEKAFLGKLIEKLPRAVGHVYALFFIIIGWLIFVFDGSAETLTLTRGLSYLGTMFGVGGAGLINSADVWDIARSGVLLVVMVIAATPVCRRWFWSATEKHRAMPWISMGVSVALFIVCVAYLVDSSFNPFLYFRF